MMSDNKDHLGQNQCKDSHYNLLKSNWLAVLDLMPIRVKRQQSTSIGTVEGGRWTRARQRVTANNESAWPMMRAATKRVARAMAMVTRVAGKQR